MPIHVCAIENNTLHFNGIFYTFIVGFLVQLFLLLYNQIGQILIIKRLVSIKSKLATQHNGS